MIRGGALFRAAPLTPRSTIRTRRPRHRCAGASKRAVLSSMSEIELWFEFGSNYSYLSVMRIEEAASAHGVRVVWRPFLLGPIFKSFGWETSPFVAQKEKGAYVW